MENYTLTEEQFNYYTELVKDLSDYDENEEKSLVD